MNQNEYSTKKRKETENPPEIVVLYFPISLGITTKKCTHVGGFLDAEPSHPQARPTPLETGQCRRHPLLSRPGILGCRPAVAESMAPWQQQQQQQQQQPQQPHDISDNSSTLRCWIKLKSPDIRDLWNLSPQATQGAGLQVINPPSSLRSKSCTKKTATHPL